MWLVSVLGIEFVEVPRACMGTQASKEDQEFKKVVAFRNSCTPSAEDSDSFYGLSVLPPYVPTYLPACLRSQPLPIVHLLTLPTLKQALDARLDHA
jgi:hypothetical protein